jgi:hypothetical protein
VQSGWQPPPQYPQYPHQPYYGPGPVPGWARPPIDTRLLRPKAWLYALSAIPVALGLGVAALCIVLAVRAFPDEPQPFTAPHTLIVRLDGGDEQTIWAQTRGAADPSVDAPPRCVVRNRGSERFVPLSRAGNTRLTINGNRYETELDFSPPADGVYSVHCRPAFGTEVQALALGDSPHLARFGALIVGAIASFLLGLVLCGGVIALVAVLRHRHKRRLQDQAMGPRPPGA